ncbi:MAG: hypothetical protein DRJ42_23405 [Deltaproteobacteria bacterium]|nr:MAG: hypothetical protein DRJ42_23405 [Deltaproteobacteria bacterium]
MDALLFHPKLVHVPMALGVLMPLIATGLVVAWWRKWLPARGWAIAVLLQGLLFGSGVLALQSGEAEEERVEEVISEDAIERHEEAAEAFVWASGAVFGVMLLGLAAAGGRPGLPIAAAAALGTIVVFGLGYRTGEAGGALVYEHGAGAAYADGAGRLSIARGYDGERGDHDDHGDDDDDDDDDDH